MTQLKAVLLLLAAAATFWAAISLATGFDTDFKTAAVVAVCCLGVTVFLDYRGDESRRREFRWERES